MSIHNIEMIKIYRIIYNKSILTFYFILNDNLGIVFRTRNSPLSGELYKYTRNEHK